jgi:hypothetical protein
MARWTGTTTQRGYGADHQRTRARLLSEFTPGQPCARCGQPIWGPPLDLGHTPDRTAYTGLEHADCNRADGARRSNGAKHVQAARPGDVRCKTCGQTYHYAARNCAICGKHYHPSGKTVLTCGRACGRELQRRNRLATGWLPRSQRPKPPPKPRQPGPVASGQRPPKNGWPSTAIETWQCRYCGKLGVRRSKPAPNSGLREVCDARICQLARRQANNLVARNGLSKADADARMVELVASAMARRRPSTKRTVTQCDGQQ